MEKGLVLKEGSKSLINNKVLFYFANYFSNINEI